jgi:hypothetical protein
VQVSGGWSGGLPHLQQSRRRRLAAATLPPPPLGPPTAALTESCLAITSSLTLLFDKIEP